MKTKITKNKTIRKTLLTVFLTVAVTMSGCEKSDLLSPDASSSTINPDRSSLVSAAGSAQSATRANENGNRPGQKYPIIASKVFKFLPDSNFYKGGTLTLGRGNGSNFHVNDSALVPPDSIPWGTDVTINMRVDFDTENGELVFTFGPHGSTFLIPARIKLHYKDLGIDRPHLYYIDEDGNYIPQVPDDINLKKRFMIINVHHFSRYALARS